MRFSRFDWPRRARGPLDFGALLWRVVIVALIAWAVLAGAAGWQP